jgi:hypothetical protein
MPEHRPRATKRRKPLHPRDRRSRKYEAWKKAIGDGMREAKLKRRQAGLMTPNEIAVELGLSRASVASLFTAIVVGGRKYIRRADVDRWRSKTGATAA